MTPDELQQFREQLGLTPTQLAKLLDVPDSTVSRWERGIIEIARPTILRLALERLRDQRTSEQPT